MIKKWMLGSSLAVVLALGAISISRAKEPSNADGVHAADAAWAKAYNAGKVDDVVALYDENAAVYPAGAAALRGRAAIHEYFTKDMEAFGKSGLTMALEANPEGGVAGDTGWSSGTWAVKDKDGKVVDSGWYFSVSKKVAGKWLYIRDAWDSNTIAAAPTTP